MRITVPLHSDPLIREKLTFHEDGKKKTYLVAKKVVNNTQVLYILPDDFPLEMVNVIFGSDAIVIDKPEKKLILAF